MMELPAPSLSIPYLYLVLGGKDHETRRQKMQGWLIYQKGFQLRGERTPLLETDRYSLIFDLAQPSYSIFQPFLPSSVVF
jgi:hypothetical protein